jgi:hypothetical protein
MKNKHQDFCQIQENTESDFRVWNLLSWLHDFIKDWGVSVCVLEKTQTGAISFTPLDFIGISKTFRSTDKVVLNDTFLEETQRSGILYLFNDSRIVQNLLVEFFKGQGYDTAVKRDRVLVLVGGF